MNSIIELHDSAVAGLIVQPGKVIVHLLPAYVHESSGRPGVDAGSGSTQEAHLTFRAASIHGIVPQFPQEIVDGDLSVGGKEFSNEVPVPLDTASPASLRLVFESDQTLTINGEGVRLELIGKRVYVEEFEGPRDS